MGIFHRFPSPRDSNYSSTASNGRITCGMKFLSTASRLTSVSEDLQPIDNGKAIKETGFLYVICVKNNLHPNTSMTRSAVSSN